MAHWRNCCVNIFNCLFAWRATGETPDTLRNKGRLSKVVRRKGAKSPIFSGTWTKIKGVSVTRPWTVSEAAGRGDHSSPAHCRVSLKDLLGVAALSGDYVFPHVARLLCGGPRRPCLHLLCWCDVPPAGLQCTGLLSSAESSPSGSSLGGCFSNPSYRTLGPCTYAAHYAKPDKRTPAKVGLPRTHNAPRAKKKKLNAEFSRTFCLRNQSRDLNTFQVTFYASTFQNLCFLTFTK